MAWSGLWATNWTSHTVVVFGSTSFILALLFFIVSFVSLFQMCRFLMNRHRIWSYQMGFLVCCFSWCIIRSLFFLFVGDWSNTGAVVLFWIPVLIQFTTFSLLVVYYIRQLYKENWKMVKKIVLAFYFAANLGFLIFLITFWALVLEEAQIDANSSPAWLDALPQLFSGIVFLILVIILGYYGIKVFLAVRTGKIAVAFQLKGASNNLILAATFVIVFIFLSRVLYDFVTISGYGSLDLESGFGWEDWIVLGLYTFWEIIPCTMILLLFWSVGKTHSEVVIGTSTGYMSQEESEEESQAISFFNNDFRYDSDTEEQAILYKNSFRAASSFHTPYATSPAGALLGSSSFNSGSSLNSSP